MTASPPEPLDALAALADKFLAPHPTVLHAGTGIVAYLRTVSQTGPALPGLRAPLLGLTVHEDPELDAAEWWVADQHGDELARGRVGEPSENVQFWPGVGFVSINLPEVTL